MDLFAVRMGTSIFAIIHGWLILLEAMLCKGAFLPSEKVIETLVAECQGKVRIIRYGSASPVAWPGANNPPYWKPIDRQLTGLSSVRHVRPVS